MQTELPSPLPTALSVLTAPTVASGRHAAPAAPRRRLARALVAFLVLVVGLGATTAALLLSGSVTRQIDGALDRLGQWPAISVDGALTGDGDPVRLVATITADGAARGTVARPGNARAEFVVGPAGTLLRGNVQWWLADQPGRAGLLADRWVRDPHDPVVDQVARGRLAPGALADALAGLRDPAQRTETEGDVGGVPATAFARPGVRLAIDRDGRPLTVATGLGTAPATMIDFRSGPALGGPASDPWGPTAHWTATLAVNLPDPADVDAVRKATAAVVAQDGDRDAAGSAPAPDADADADAQPGTANPVGIDGHPDTAGCRPTGCTVRYRLTNRGDATVMGLFTVRVDDVHVVAARSLTLPPRTAAVVAVEIPVRLVTAHPDRVRVAARFTPYGAV